MYFIEKSAETRENLYINLKNYFFETENNLYSLAEDIIEYLSSEIRYLKVFNFDNLENIKETEIAFKRKRNHKT